MNGAENIDLPKLMDEDNIEVYLPYHRVKLKLFRKGESKGHSAVVKGVYQPFKSLRSKILPNTRALLCHFADPNMKDPKTLICEY